METFYGGIDLHAKNAQVRAINGKGVAVKVSTPTFAKYLGAS